MMDTSCIDLFCGVGGLTHGLKKSGINVVAGVDTDIACRHPFETNNIATFLLQDVATLKPELLIDHFSSASRRILAGCAPCQPFSTYSRRYETIGTERWGLMYHFARLIKSIKPNIIAMENVPTVTKHEVYQDFVNLLKSDGYFVWNGIVDCKEYGLPQSRNRAVLLASRDGPINILPSAKNTITTLRAAIGEMPKLLHGEISSADRLHRSAKLSDLNLKRIRASRPGGSWREWPKELVAQCHQKQSGQTYRSVYSRMMWDQPSPTLTTQFYGFGNGRFGHPEQDRAISLREGAILQGFPSEYSFLSDQENAYIKTLGRLIGNAVPVTLGEVIGQSIQKHINQTDNAVCENSLNAQFSKSEPIINIQNKIDNLMHANRFASKIGEGDKKWA